MRLIELQRRFQVAILDPRGSAGAGLGLAAGSKLQIHHSHFWSRMHDFVAMRHPLLARFLGEAELDDVVRAYIVAQPPQSFVASSVAERLTEFLFVTEPWSAFPIIGHLAAFDFLRSAIAIRAEEATLRTTEYVHAKLRLKKRAGLITTRFKFHRVRISELDRTTKVDDEPIYLLVHMTNRRYMTTELDHVSYQAFQRLVEGTTLRDLGEYLRLGAADLGRFIARCVHADLLVATGGECASA